MKMFETDDIAQGKKKCFEAKDKNVFFFLFFLLS